MMGRLHLVRVGANGQIGRFGSSDARHYERGTRVVVRTERGLEVGDVLLPPGARTEALGEESDGTILRRLTVEDELLLARLSRHRAAALHACVRRIEELKLPIALVDVEQLFDGSTLVFHFLGPQVPELDSLMEELAEAYESKVQFRQFAETVTAGCGPGCGTEEGAGCGSCSTGCAVADACSTRKRG
ncbi:MAG: hypothetical protein KF708_12075 [Pirellulales bacterium]|nr:hypothetical protein [Pirellulales bacterium]